jgi:hypothetical protein
MLHLFARFVNYIAEREGDWLQMWQKTVKNLIGKISEQPVFNRTLRFVRKTIGHKRLAVGFDATEYSLYVS